MAIKNPNPDTRWKRKYSTEHHKNITICIKSKMMLIAIQLAMTKYKGEKYGENNVTEEPSVSNL